MILQGLKGVVAAETAIAHVDGEQGQLIYRGYEIGEVTANYSFEEAAYLLWYGKLTNEEETQKLKAALRSGREIPSYLADMIGHLPTEMNMMSVLRTVISAEGRLAYGWKPSIAEAIRLTAMVPVIIAFRKRQQEGKSIVHPKEDLDHVANYLYMLTGEIPSATHVNALETYMILTMEHGMNASTFSARVTVSTESDLVSAITAAIGTMKGPLHGGAPAEVISLLDEIKEAGDVETVLRDKLNRGEKLMGFGHRIYKTIDPRSVALKSKLLAFAGEDEWLDLSIKVEEVGIELLAELKPGRSLFTNVEFYAAAIMKAIDMDKELFTSTFSASRMVGWTAHVLEQAMNNVIFRPQSKYTGPFK
ncbi:citrate synthase/methylcitrate synthase [Cytobacillus purgationiresistens]|uniref:Citrate synthase n=1 Tax=Cytobacillus purgationiresistens TaxID=863449 RepID=A0ABU0ANH1_9BACI|nr:citrate synthase/methylcitrate synthase [Cytobacillus purgationiresistens]MDQ0272834.1 citrate synthase [Cytobacillus purgationiresistens]